MTVCILTNNAALFPSAVVSNGRFLRTLALTTASGAVIPPTFNDFSRVYTELEREFNAMLVLLAPEAILPGLEAATQAARSHGGTAKISVLDSQQVGPGLGLLAQLGAQKAAAGASLAEVQETIRKAIPFLFTLICPDTTPPSQVPELSIDAGSYKPKTGALTLQSYISRAQDEQNEASTVIPIYSLEEGCLTAYKKVRTRRHLLETMQEFLEEFERPQQLAYFRGYTSRLRTRPLREAASGLFPGTPFTEMELNAPLATLFGAQAFGMTILEMPA